MNEKEFLSKLRELRRKKMPPEEKEVEMRKLKFIFYPKKELVKLFNDYLKSEEGRKHLLFFPDTNRNNVEIIQIHKIPIRAFGDVLDTHEMIMLYTTNILLSKLAEEGELVPFTEGALMFKPIKENIKFELKPENIEDAEFFFKILYENKEKDGIYCLAKCFDRFILVKETLFIHYSYPLAFDFDAANIISINQEKLKKLAILWGLK